MMKTKVIIKAYFPSLDITCDIKVPVNEVIWKVKKLIYKAVYDMNGVACDLSSKILMMNKTTSQIYNDDEILIDTDIRNGSEIIIIPIINNGQ